MVLKKRTDKRGLGAFAWILLGALLMFVLFVPVDLALQAVQSHEFNGVLDNAVASAVTQIEEDKISTGEVEINSDRAMEVVYDVISSSYNLEYEKVSPNNYHFKESSLENSKLKELPHVEVRVVGLTREEIRNNVTKEALPFQSVAGEEVDPLPNDGYIYKNIKSDTVVIRVAAKFPSQILSKGIGFEFDRVSAAQAELTGPGEEGGN